jgi:hypothetical protein
MEIALAFSGILDLYMKKPIHLLEKTIAANKPRPV